MSITKKNWILLAAFLITLWVCYELALAPTFLLKQENTRLELKQQQYQNTLATITNLKAQNSAYDTLLNTYKISSDISLQSNLLEIVNTYCINNRLTIISFDKAHRFEENKNLLNTYSFKVRGSYTSILKLIYNLEQKNKFGKVSSVFFEKKKNYRTYRSYLNCEVYLQKIKQ